MSTSTKTMSQPTLDRVIEATVAMIQMHPTYDSGGQRHVIDFLDKELSSLGATTRRCRIKHEEIEAHPCYTRVEDFGGAFATYRDSQRENLLAEIDFGEGGPCILLNGHIDVEFVTAPALWTHPQGWRQGIIENGRIYGRGSSDMLGAVACFLAAAATLAAQKEQLRGRLLLHFVVDEEIGGNGTLQALSELADHVDMALIGEPTNGAVCTESRSFEQFKIVCTGAPRHMCASASSDNAAYQAALVLEAIERVDGWCRAQAPSATGVRSLCAGVVNAGSDAAVPAASAELLVTAALPPGLPLSLVLERLQQELRGLACVPTRSPQVEPYGLRFPGSTLGHDRLADIVRDALCSAADGKAVSAVHSFPSACDARIFESFGIPTVIYGPGSLERAHGSDEYVEIEELRTYLHVLTESLRACFDTSPRGEDNGASR